MAAPMRNFCAFGRKLLQCRQQKHLWRNKRLASSSSSSDSPDKQDPNYYHNYTVPYFPEEEAKRSLQAEYPDVEISREDFKYVERLLPSKTVPPPIEHDQYPTPSGWLPPNVELQPADYGVRRTRNHMLPLYYRKHFNGRITTNLNHVYGDIWKLRDDVQQYLNDQTGEKVDIQVHEIGRFVRFRGNHVENVAKFLLDKGF